MGEKISPQINSPCKVATSQLISQLCEDKNSREEYAPCTRLVIDVRGGIE